jgi:putative tricarboxylic transport membrane protein
MLRRFDFLASLVFMLIGLFFTFASSTLASNVIGGTVTPGTFPRVFGIVLMLLSIALLLETVKSVEKSSPSAGTVYYQRFGVIVAAMTAYIVLIEPLGFVISSFLFLLVTFQAMKRGQILKSVLIAAGFAAVMHFVFIQLLEASVKSWPSIF